MYTHTNCDLHLCALPHYEVQTGPKARQTSFRRCVDSFPTSLLKTLRNVQLRIGWALCSVFPWCDVPDGQTQHCSLRHPITACVLPHCSGTLCSPSDRLDQEQPARRSVRANNGRRKSPRKCLKYICTFLSRLDGRAFYFRDYFWVARV